MWALSEAQHMCYIPLLPQPALSLCVLLYLTCEVCVAVDIPHMWGMSHWKGSWTYLTCEVCSIFSSSFVEHTCVFFVYNASWKTLTCIPLWLQLNLCSCSVNVHLRRFSKLNNSYVILILLTCEHAQTET